jgi:hypothetical protein
MARQQTTPPSLIPIVEATLVALGFVVLFAKLDGPAARFTTKLLGATAKTALELLLSLVPTAWQALQAYAVDHQCPLHLLVSLWPLLHVIAGAA